MNKIESTDFANEGFIFLASQKLQDTWDSLNQRYPDGDLLSIYRRFNQQTDPLPKGVRKVAGASEIVIFKDILDHSLKASQRYLRRFPGRNTDQEDLVSNVISRNWSRLNCQRTGLRDAVKEPVLSLEFPITGIDERLHQVQNPEQIVIDLEVREIIQASNSADLDKLRDLLTLTPEEIELKEIRIKNERRVYLEKGRQRFYGYIQRLDLAGISEFIKNISGGSLPEGVEADQLDNIIQTYRLPEFLKFFHTGSRYLAPVKRRFAELLFAMQYAPTQNKGDLNLNDLPPDRLLLACLASGREEILYPDLDEEERVVATTHFSVTRAQKYFIERKVRESLAQSQTFKRLYPSRKAGNVTTYQDPNGELHYRLGGNKDKYKNAVLDFPIGNRGLTLNLALAETGRKNEAAHYRHSMEIIALVEGSLKRKLSDTPANRQEIKNTALHE